MKSKNPIRTPHRERLLDLRANTTVPRPGRLDLSTNPERPQAVRVRLLHEHFRHESDDPDSWVNRQLQRRIERIRERGDTAPDIALPIAW